MRRRDPQQAGRIISLALQIMDCPVEILEDIKRETDQAVRAELLETWKAEAKKAYRQAVLKHHPDRGGDAEKLVILNEGWELIQSMQLAPTRPPPPPPPPPAPRTVVTMRFHGFRPFTYTDSSNTSTTTGTGFGGAGFWTRF